MTSAMPQSLTLVTLDGLSTAGLGCYSSWNATPNLDGIAAGGCVWDRWTTPTDDPHHQFQNWAAQAQLFQTARQFGRIELITDDSRLLKQPIENAFDQICLIDPILPDDDQPADDIGATQFGQLVAAAVERSQQTDPISLLWIHSQFLTRCWDAPRSLLDLDMLDDDSQEPADEHEEFFAVDEETEEKIPPFFSDTKPPEFELNDSVHPDILTSWMTTYGCQIRLVDELLGILMQSVSLPNNRLLLTSTSGFSLGQNGWIGHRCGPLRSCHTKLPLLVGGYGPRRSAEVVSAESLSKIVNDLFSDQSPIPDDSWASSQQELVPCIATEGETGKAITCPSWFLVQENGNEKLFLKPDDMDDVNDISRLRLDVVDQLLDSNP